jgi:ubiquitin carboxyl-terminal hydrolase 7
MAEGFGLQDAKKGVIFESFPPVLHLQFKRFEVDMMRETAVKVSDWNAESRISCHEG